MTVVEQTGMHYKWIALSNTTLGLLMATINSSIVLIALPDIFRGIGIDPLGPRQHQLPAVDDHGIPGRHGGAGGRLRPPRRHVRPRADVQPRLRRVHRGVDPAGRHLADRRRGGAVADRLAHRAGHRRRVHHGQLHRDPHRRLPRRPARHRARHQRRRRDRGLVPRPGDRRPARPAQLAPGLPRVGAVRRLRHDLGLPQAARHRRAQAREDGLVGQHHVRRRPHRAADRHHLRHPALRRQHDGLGQPARADLRDRRRSSCSCSSP